jgi:hypothetical protein
MSPKTFLPEYRQFISAGRALHLPVCLEEVLRPKALVHLLTAAVPCLQVATREVYPATSECLRGRQRPTFNPHPLFQVAQVLSHPWPKGVA